MDKSSVVSIFGCGGYLSTAVLESLSIEGYSVRPFSTSRPTIEIGGKQHRVRPYSPQACPPRIVHDSDLIINLCTEGVGHKKTYEVETLFNNIDIVNACAELAAKSRGRKLLHIGSYHEVKLAPYCNAIARSISRRESVIIDFIGNYELSKSLQTITLANLSRIHNISILVALAPNIYGPPNPPNSLASHLDELCISRDTPILRNPSERITTVPISEFASAITGSSKSLIACDNSPQCVIEPIMGKSWTVEAFADFYLRKMRQPH